MVADLEWSMEIQMAAVLACTSAAAKEVYWVHSMVHWKAVQRVYQTAAMMVVYLERFSVVAMELKKVALLDHYWVVAKADLLVLKSASWKVGKRDKCLVGSKAYKKDIQLAVQWEQNWVQLKVDKKVLN